MSVHPLKWICCPVCGTKFLARRGLCPYCGIGEVRKGQVCPTRRITKDERPLSKRLRDYLWK